jgi:hypothetical protein
MIAFIKKHPILTAIILLIILALIYSSFNRSSETTVEEVASLSTTATQEQETTVEPEPTIIVPPNSSDEETEATPETLNAEQSNTEAPTTSTETLIQLVGQLNITEENNSPYDRDDFKHWVDADSDGCDARREVLKTETLTTPVIETGCKIVSGQWYSPYDNTTLTDPSKLDIDHMVPLKEAWRSGAHLWTDNKREAYANDLTWEYSLIAVTAGSNRSKSDQDPSDWMPTNTEYTCDYVYAWVSVKIRWQLTVDTDEHNTLKRIAETACQTYTAPAETIPIIQ